MSLQENTDITPSEQEEIEQPTDEMQVTRAEDQVTSKDKDQPKKKKKKLTAKQYALRLAIKIGITVLVITLLLVFVFGVYVNHSNSSYPMIKDGDLCLTYKLGDIRQGDVVAYEANGETKFARVIALEGDNVEIKNDYVAVNGIGIFEETVYSTSAEGSSISYPYKVPSGTVFVLNDFRSDTSDSRTLGGIPLSDCKGKVIFVMRRRGI